MAESEVGCMRFFSSGLFSRGLFVSCLLEMFEQRGRHATLKSKLDYLDLKARQLARLSRSLDAFSSEADQTPPRCPPHTFFASLCRSVATNRIQSRGC